jgi:AbiV family abortive infection protein
MTLAGTLLVRLGDVDARVVRDGSRAALVGYVQAIGENARGLLDDAELLLAKGRHARAYALAVLSVEEFGKATGVIALVLMPAEDRAAMSVRSVGKLLEQHKQKQLGGMLLPAVQWGKPGMSARLAATPADQLAELFDSTTAQAETADQLKLRGLYADIARDGSISRPCTSLGL